MRIVAQYSFCRGLELITSDHPGELREVTDAIRSIDAELCRTKKSREKTMRGRLLYAPKVINAAILNGFLYNPPYSWDTPDRKLPIRYDIPGIGTKTVTFTTDGVKNRVALEIQLGKYCFAEYDILAKLPTYRKFGRVECAIEVLPMNSFSHQMSTGPGWFERTATILENRGCGNLDIPVLLLGIDC
jgi:hypothetical protein